MFVAMPDGEYCRRSRAHTTVACMRKTEHASRRVAGKWKLHTVSAASNKHGEIVLRIKKANLVMAFSHAKESKSPVPATPSPLFYFTGRTELMSGLPVRTPQAS
jgi:hypothetical protein